jgi:2',3'-cyclic-nucleotide 2'-phosphodiesterase (5'-nucleotidase family)
MASNVRILGVPLQAEKTYRMAINNFQASGGDGYPTMVDTPALSTQVMWMRMCCARLLLRTTR